MKRIWILAWYYKIWVNDISRVSFEYISAITQHNNVIPYIIPANINNSIIEAYIQDLDAFIIPWGNDIDPNLYWEKVSGSVDYNREYDLKSIYFAQNVISSWKPLLWICRGMQLINVTFGWKLNQHIDNSDVHFQFERQYEHIHDIRIIWIKSFLSTSLWVKTAPVNSIHHQWISVLWNWLHIVAESTWDNIIEAIEHKELPIYGVQWHPERLSDYKKLFQWFVQQ